MRNPQRSVEDALGFQCSEEHGNEYTSSIAFAGTALVGKRKSSLPFDKRGGTVVIQRRLLNSGAYLELSAQAKALAHLMQVHWRPDEPIGFGVREAEKKIPCCRRTAMSAFRELQDGGFIKMVEESRFCSRTQSKTRTWRLTWLPWNCRAPSNDWEKLDAN